MWIALLLSILLTPVTGLWAGSPPTVKSTEAYLVRLADAEKELRERLSLRPTERMFQELFNSVLLQARTTLSLHSLRQRQILDKEWRNVEQPGFVTDDEIFGIAAPKLGELAREWLDFDPDSEGAHLAGALALESVDRLHALSRLVERFPSGSSLNYLEDLITDRDDDGQPSLPIEAEILERAHDLSQQAVGPEQLLDRDMKRAVEAQGLKAGYEVVVTSFREQPLMNGTSFESALWNLMRLEETRTRSLRGERPRPGETWFALFHLLEADLNGTFASGRGVSETKKPSQGEPNTGQGRAERTLRDSLSSALFALGNALDQVEAPVRKSTLASRWVDLVSDWIHEFNTGDDRSPAQFPSIPGFFWRDAPEEHQERLVRAWAGIDLALLDERTSCHDVVGDVEGFRNGGDILDRCLSWMFEESLARTTTRESADSQNVSRLIDFFQHKAREGEHLELVHAWRRTEPLLGEWFEDVEGGLESLAEAWFSSSSCEVFDVPEAGELFMAWEGVRGPAEHEGHWYDIWLETAIPLVGRCESLPPGLKLLEVGAPGLVEDPTPREAALEAVHQKIEGRLAFASSRGLLRLRTSGETINRILRLEIRGRLVGNAEYSPDLLAVVKRLPPGEQLMIANRWHLQESLPDSELEWLYSLARRILLGLEIKDEPGSTQDLARAVAARLASIAVENERSSLALEFLDSVVWPIGFDVGSWKSQEVESRTTASDRALIEFLAAERLDVSDLNPRQRSYVLLWRSRLAWLSGYGEEALDLLLEFSSMAARFLHSQEFLPGFRREISAVAGSDSNYHERFWDWLATQRAEFGRMRDGSRPNRAVLQRWGMTLRLLEVKGLRVE